MLLTIVAAAAGGIRPAEAQGRPFQTSSEGLIVGRFLIHPSLSLDFLHDNNVFYRSQDLPSGDDFGSGEIMVKPRILVDLPIGSGRVRWSYASVYRSYTNDSVHLPRQFSHYFDLEAALRIGPVLHVTLREHYVKGVLEVQEVDRGGELTVGLTPFTSTEPSMQIDLDLGSRQGLSILPRYNSVQYEESPDASLLGYRGTQLEGRYNYRLSSADILFGYYSREQTNQRRGSVLFPDLVLDGQGAGFGLIRTINEDVTASVTAGYKKLTFTGGDATNYGGLAADANVTLQPTESSSLVLIAGRQPYQSFFLDQSHYLDDQLGFRYLRQFGRSVYGEISGTIRRNSYPGSVDLSVRPGTPATEDCAHNGSLDSSDCNNNTLIDSLETSYCLEGPGGSLECPSEGIKRRDRVLNFQIGAGYRVLRTLRIFIGYNNDRRRSNIDQVSGGVFFDPFDYNVHRIFFRIEAGWM